MADCGTSQNDVGVIYIAFGYDYLVMALNSIRSVKEQHTNLDVSIVTNIQIKNIESKHVLKNKSKTDGMLLDEIIKVNEPTSKNRDYKTSIHQFTPYKKTLFLDCDTVIRNEIIQGFNFLDWFDIALVSRPIPSRAMVNRWDGDIDLSSIKIEDSTTFYGGVFFFDKDKSVELFERWNNLYNSLGYDYDQFSLLRSIYETETNVLPLPVIWNTMDSDIKRYEGYYADYDFRDEIKIHHQNRGSISRMRTLRNLEKDTAKLLLDVDSEKKRELRSDFHDRHNYKSAIKGELGKYQLIKKLHSKVTNHI